MRASGALLALSVLAALPAAGVPASNSVPTPPTASPYTADKTRTLKALSPEDIAALREGRGMGLSKPAELNRHPGPRHALDFAAELNLTPAQQREIQAIFDRMHTQAVALGERIVAQEQALEKLFIHTPAPALAVRQVTTDIGRLNGMLRFVHLQAHIDTTKVLTPAQIESYDRLRGYANSRRRAEPDAQPTPAPHAAHGAHTH